MNAKLANADCVYSVCWHHRLSIIG